MPPKKEARNKLAADAPESVVANTVATETGGAQVALVGSVAFAVGIKGLASYSVAGAKPELLHHVSIDVGSSSAPTCGMTITSDEDKQRVYVVGLSGIASFDVSDPRDIKIIARVENTIAGNPTGQGRHPGGHVAVSNAVYVASARGIASYDKDTLVHLATMQNDVATIKGGTSVEAVGRLLCVAGTRGVNVYNVTDPRSPQIFGKITDNDCEGTITDVCLEPHGVRLIVASGRGLAVYDVGGTNPQLLTKLQHDLSMADTGVPRASGVHLAVNGTKLFMAGADGIAAYNVSTGSMTLLRKTQQYVGTPKAGVDIQANDHYVVASGALGLAILPRNEMHWPEPPPRNNACENLAKAVNGCAVM